MKKLIILFFILLNNFAFAQVDYDVKAITRSYPVALSFVGTLGYGLKFWGNDSGPFFGYVRPSLYAHTSGVVNGAGVQLDFFPVSFFGFYAGSKKVVRSTDDLGSYDCSVIICDGSMSRTYFGSKFAFKLKSFFIFVDGKVEDVEMDSKVGVFAEETGTLLGQSGGDTLTQVTATAGFELNSKLSIGALVQHTQMDKIENKSIMSLAITRMKWDKVSLLVGAGQFHTRQSTDHFTILAVLTWKGEKGLPLF